MIPDTVRLVRNAFWIGFFLLSLTLNKDDGHGIVWWWVRPRARWVRILGRFTPAQKAKMQCVSPCTHYVSGTIRLP